MARGTPDVVLTLKRSFMKIGFSTIGCPGWDFSEIFSAATDLKYSGIEFRGVGEEIFMPKVKAFMPENIKTTKAKFKNAGLYVPIFTSGAVLSDKAGIKDTMSEAKEYVKLAAAFGTKYIRVLADRNPAPDKLIDEKFLIENLKEICAFAETLKIKVLIETNGYYAVSESAVCLIKKTEAKNLFLIWDAHHTFRYGGESAEKSFRTLGKYIKHVHIKDSKIIDGKLCYKFPGEGDVPIAAVIKLLTDAGFKGCLCLEWVKRWEAELAEPGIILPAFKFFADNIIAGEK